MAPTATKSSKAQELELNKKNSDDNEEHRPRPKQWGNIFTIATICFGLMGLVFIHYITKINQYAIENAPEGYQLVTWDKLWVSCASAAVIYLFRCIFDLLEPCIRGLVPEKNQDDKPRTEAEMRKESLKVLEHFYDAAFYFLSAYCGWLICKDHDWYPGYLGGSGDLAKSLDNLPFPIYDPTLPTFALITFGFRIEGFIRNGWLKERGNDYMEMFFHDVVTIFLFLGAIYAYWLPAGMVVVIIHDITDSPIHIAKGLYSTKLADFSPVFFIGAQIGWAYLRLYCFPKLAYTVYECSYPAGRDHFNGIRDVIVAFLCALICLHILWFIMFQRVNLAVFRKNKNIIEETGHIGSDSPSATPERPSQKDNFSSEAKTKN